jgi:hypothetical protein
VHSVTFAVVILADLKCLYPEHRITIDMEDVDKVLRVEGLPFDGDTIINYLNQQGFMCIEI